MYSTFWNGVGAACQFIFKIISPVGALIDLMFILIIAAGFFYWLIYGARMERGGKNYLSQHVD